MSRTRTHTHLRANMSLALSVLTAPYEGDPGRQLFLALVSSFLPLHSACCWRLLLHSNEDIKQWKKNRAQRASLHTSRESAQMSTVDFKSNSFRLIVTAFHSPVLCFKRTLFVGCYLATQPCQMARAPGQ